MPHGDIAKNGRRFGEHPVAVDQRRHAPFRVDAKTFRAILLVGGEIDARKLKRRADLLERNVRGERARARGIVELHRLSLFASLPINKSPDRRRDPDQHHRTHQGSFSWQFRYELSAISVAFKYLMSVGRHVNPPEMT